MEKGKNPIVRLESIDKQLDWSDCCKDSEHFGSQSLTKEKVFASWVKRFEEKLVRQQVSKLARTLQQLFIL